MPSGSFLPHAMCSRKNFARRETRLQLPPIEQRHARIVQAAAYRRICAVQVTQKLCVSLNLRSEFAAQFRQRGFGIETVLVRSLVIDDPPGGDVVGGLRRGTGAEDAIDLHRAQTTRNYTRPSRFACGIGVRSENPLRLRIIGGEENHLERLSGECDRLGRRRCQRHAGLRRCVAACGRATFERLRSFPWREVARNAETFRARLCRARATADRLHGARKAGPRRPAAPQPPMRIRHLRADSSAASGARGLASRAEGATQRMPSPEAASDSIVVGSAAAARSADHSSNWRRISVSHAGHAVRSRLSRGVTSSGAAPSVVLIRRAREEVQFFARARSGYIKDAARFLLLALTAHAIHPGLCGAAIGSFRRHWGDEKFRDRFGLSAIGSRAASRAPARKAIPACCCPRLPVDRARSRPRIRGPLLREWSSIARRSRSRLRDRAGP